MAKKRRGRSISGILVLDKPLGISSNAALQKVKGIFGAAKAGHTGCLDPLATGVLPVCLGESTKFSQYLLDSDKAYSVTGRLGEKTNTGDGEGSITDRYDIPVNLDYQQLENACSQFIGDIEQRPPMYSALKKNGQPLYKLARRGIEIDVPARPVTIYEIQLKSLDIPLFDADVKCSKGTYIRSLAQDIGKQCGAGAAHITALRRTCSGPFSLDQAYSLDHLEYVYEQGGWSELDRLLLPVNGALTDIPKVVLGGQDTVDILHGHPVTLSQEQLRASLEGKVQLISLSSDHGPQFLGVGLVSPDGSSVIPKRLVVEPVAVGE